MSITTINDALLYLPDLRKSSSRRLHKLVDFTAGGPEVTCRFRLE